MNRKILFLLALIFANLNAIQAQNNWCGFDHLHQQAMEQDPTVAQAVEEYINNIHRGAALSAMRSDEKYIIPTVVHVTYQDCEGDISLGQIQDALKVLNDDFNRLNADANETRSDFMPFAAGMNIEFRLAQIDPNGNPTDGITHTQTAQSVNANNAIKSLVNWPSSRYFNIWVVESIQNFTGGAGTILGYAQFPNSGSWSTYGIVIRNDAMGRVGTSSADGRTLTHEVGHCFGLYHTFQSSCGNNCISSGDNICDTPPAFEATYDCNQSRNTCSNDAVGSASVYTNDVNDQIENYMSYDACQNMFTIGQRNVMIATIENVSTIQNLVSLSNLQATGVVGLVKADAATELDIVCEGQPIQLYNKTSYDAEQFDWQFGGYAIPSQDTVSNPLVTFYNSGLQVVDLTASTGAQSVSATKNVFVLSNIGQFAPHADDFESMTGFPSSDWFAVNSDLDAHEWQLTTDAAYSGQQSLMVNNLGVCGTRSDKLFTQSYDFSVFNSVTMDFKTSFAQFQSGDNDYLRIAVSTDCGENWNLVWVQGGNTLAGGNSPQTSAFIPASAEQWKSQSLTLGANYMKEGTIIRFEFVGRGGNNFYFDDFALTGVFSGNLLLKSPENGKRGLSSNVLLDWKAVGGVDYYEFQLDTDSNFNSPALVSGTKTYIDETPENSDTEIEISGLSSATTYFWRVRYNQDGVFSNWSETWKFEVSETGVGINNLNVASSAIYPNPAKDYVIISNEKALESVTLIDFTGRVVSTIFGQRKSQLQMDISSLGQGIYLLNTRDISGAQTMHQLVIQK